MIHNSFPHVCQPLYLWREELSRRVVYNVGLELDTPYKFWLRHLLAGWLLASNSTSWCLVFLICKMGIVIISISYRFVVKKYQNNALHILQARILSGLPCAPPGGLPDPVIELMSSALQADSLPLVPLNVFSLFFKFVCSLSNKLNSDSDENDSSYHFMKFSPFWLTGQLPEKKIFNRSPHQTVWKRL